MPFLGFISPARTFPAPWELLCCALGLWNALFIDIFWEQQQKNCRLCIHCPFSLPTQKGRERKRKKQPKKPRLKYFLVTKGSGWIWISLSLLRFRPNLQGFFSGEIKTLELFLFSPAEQTGAVPTSSRSETKPARRLPGETLPGDFPS